MHTTLAQPGFIADVVNRIKRGGREDGIQQELDRHHLNVKLKHQQAGQREAEVKRQQIQQRKEHVEVKTDAPKLLISQRQNKQRANQVDDK
ncbi:hypothetical protein D3C81_1814610 [compost metagenome]